MNPSDWPLIQELFFDLLAAHPSAREGCLAQHPEHIREEVLSLLNACRNPSPFFDESPAHLATHILAEQPHQLAPGEPVASYIIEAMISVGGMGEVYRAHRSPSGEPIALKLLRRHLAANANAIERFRREASAIQALSHPNIVALHEFGDDPSGLFLAMEWVDGATLRDRFAEPIPFPEALSIATQLADALAAAHAAGLIHRDIKPENIMVSASGQIKILDFGLAKQTGSQWAAPELLGGSGTISGTLSGTLPYMSPELFLAEPATQASDVFSMGSVLYELFTSRHPFAGHTPLDVFAAIESSTPLPPSQYNPSLPGELDQLLTSVLSRDPALRPTAAQISLQLQRYHQL